MRLIKWLLRYSHPICVQDRRAWFTAYTMIDGWFWCPWYVGGPIGFHVFQWGPFLLFVRRRGDVF